MPLIELNLDKPALKRVEGTDEKSGEQTDDDSGESDEKSGGRFGRVAKMLTTVVVAVVGIITFRKLRQRRKES